MATFVVCIDGTWNAPGDLQADPIDPALETNKETNVHRVFRFLTGELKDSTCADATQRPRSRRGPFHIGLNEPAPGEVFYLAGVGTFGNWVTNKLAGVTGAGTTERILEAYRFLAERYHDGDRIFGFGFSRGAFAVRSLAGVLHHVGLPSAPRQLTDAEIEDVERRYKSRDAAPSGFRPVQVDFLGVWDTVGALRGNESFHDVSPPNVSRVSHALALDEQRRDFTPMYWTGGGSATEVEEVWFAGVHSNIGGGYENPQLSNIALAWMMSRAVVWAGLPTGKRYIPQWYGENSMAPGNDSHREFLAPLWLLGRLVKGSRRPREILPAHHVHASVYDRIERVPRSDYVTATTVAPADWDEYRPAALLNAHLLPDRRTVFAKPLAETLDYQG